MRICALVCGLMLLASPAWADEADVYDAVRGRVYDTETMAGDPATVSFVGIDRDAARGVALVEVLRWTEEGAVVAESWHPWRVLPDGSVSIAGRRFSPPAMGSGRMWEIKGGGQALEP